MSQRVVHRLSIVRALASNPPHSGGSAIWAKLTIPLMTRLNDSSIVICRVAPTNTPSTPSSASSTSDAMTCWLRFIASVGTRCGS